MKQKEIENYIKKNPKKAKLIKEAVHLGVKQYNEVFRKLALN